MSQITRKNVTVDANSARVAPQISGLLAGEDGIKAGMPCRVDSNGEIVRSNASSAGDEANVDGFAATDADTGDPVTLYGAGTRFQYAESLTKGATLYLASANGELDDAPQPGDPDGVAVAISGKDIVVQRVGQAAPFDRDVIDGGSAGNHTVTGIEVGDVLVAVIQFVDDGTQLTDVADLTGEFSIDSADTIDNAGGTDTSGDHLLVIWKDLT